MAGEVHDYYITSDKKFQQKYFYPDPGIDFWVDLNNNTCIETQDISFKIRTLCKGDSINVNEKYYSQDGTYKLIRPDKIEKKQKEYKKLKMIDLKLKKEKQDKDVTNDSNFTEGEGYVVTDRNSLLQRLKGIDKDK